MKNNYYVIRAFRNGRAASGYDYGQANRFATLDMAEANAAEFAAEVLPTTPYDIIYVGEGAIRNGRSVGLGRRITQYSVKGHDLGGEIIRIDA